MVPLNWSDDEARRRARSASGGERASRRRPALGLAPVREPREARSVNNPFAPWLGQHVKLSVLNEVTTTISSPSPRTEPESPNPRPAIKRLRRVSQSSSGHSRSINLRPVHQKSYNPIHTLEAGTSLVILMGLRRFMGGGDPLFSVQSQYTFEAEARRREACIEALDLWRGRRPTRPLQLISDFAHLRPP
ncbi:hypothetical protein EVAR_74216_1 [Eumeta japonica]|uniref:Uncharacterized protein n=1 Tax=Eumeta variegata TaxID=151549 RepID=A0A4C1SFC1_EUMVA|nr:hypothetical protein EVAR_74216_1 [Eumeta japonica]